MKAQLHALLRRSGYQIARVAEPPSDPDSMVAATLPPSECYGRFETVCPIFQPWLGYGDFRDAYAGVSSRTLVTADRCYLLHKFAQHARQLPGDFIECGVFRGGTALLLARTASTQQKKLWLFDSFEGLSDASAGKGDFYQRGEFSTTSFDDVAQLLRPFAPAVELRKGWIPASFTGLEHLQFAFAHVDVDLYEPALETCRYVYPRLVTGGVMIFDDYGYPACRGERQAVDEFFADKSQPVIALPTGQALVIKT
jgi:O-methyltransferase